MNCVFCCIMVVNEICGRHRNVQLPRFSAPKVPVDEECGQSMGMICVLKQAFCCGEILIVPAGEWHFLVL